MIGSDLKDFYAWLDFEEIAHQMAQELGVE
jgi:hypothetical protein